MRGQNSVNTIIQIAQNKLLENIFEKSYESVKLYQVTLKKREMTGSILLLIN